MEVLVILSTVLVLIGTAPGVYSFDLSFRKAIAECLTSNDTMICFSVKGISAFNHLARIAKLEIFPGVSIKRDSTMSARVAKAVSEKEIIDSFPADESERGGYLFELAIFSMADFIETHTLELKFPQESSRALARAFEEGRFIKKKHMGKLALAIALKALLLAAAALMQHCKKGHHHGAYVKLVGNGAGAVQTDVNPGTGFAEQYPYDRGYDNAQDLAYNAYTY